MLETHFLFRTEGGMVVCTGLCVFADTEARGNGTHSGNAFLKLAKNKKQKQRNNVYGPTFVYWIRSQLSGETKHRRRRRLRSYLVFYPFLSAVFSLHNNLRIISFFKF